jgi:hypothetical protein
VLRLSFEGRFLLSIDGPLFGSTVSERADRPSVRTSPQVARRESIAPDGFTCGRSPLGRPTEDTPGRKGRREGAPLIREPMAYGEKTPRASRPNAGPLQGPLVRGAPEGLAHHTGSSQKVSLKTLPDC